MCIEYSNSRNAILSRWALYWHHCNVLNTGLWYALSAGPKLGQHLICNATRAVGKDLLVYLEGLDETPVAVVLEEKLKIKDMKSEYPGVIYLGNKIFNIFLLTSVVCPCSWGSSSIHEWGSRSAIDDVTHCTTCH